jgi:hypothetical protein
MPSGAKARLFGVVDVRAEARTLQKSEFSRRTTDRRVKDKTMDALLPPLSSRAYPDFLLHRLTSDHVCGSPQENHMQSTAATTLDRKSGGAEGPAVLRTFRGNVFL